MVCDGTEDAARPELNLQGAIPQGAESHTAPISNRAKSQSNSMRSPAGVLLRFPSPRDEDRF
jgi:hypothetical protein